MYGLLSGKNVYLWNNLMNRAMARIYVASSWRNPYFPDVVNRLRAAGHEVYDFRNPPHGGAGFLWTDV